MHEPLHHVVTRCDINTFDVIQVIIFFQFTTQILTLWTNVRSVSRSVKENRCMVLRLTFAAVIGILVVVVSGFAVWKTEGTGQV